MAHFLSKCPRDKHSPLRKQNTPAAGRGCLDLDTSSADQVNAPITASMRFFMVDASNGLMM